MSALGTALPTVREDGSVDLAPRDRDGLHALVAEAVDKLDGGSPGRIVRDRFGSRLRVSAAVATRLGVDGASDTAASTAPKRRRTRKTTDTPGSTATTTEKD